METYTIERLKSHPDFPREYCLEPGELLGAFPGFRVALYREIPPQETASILALKGKG
jgi:hypothetical protein